MLYFTSDVEKYIPSVNVFSIQQVQEAVKNVTDKLAEAAFSGTGGDDTSSVATNSLLIHLGLIKCEVRAAMTVMMTCWNNKIF